MRDPEQFDAFYRDARERLLVQTYALTGDLAASRRAVRDAFIVAWHHWRKYGALDNPESVVRPHAWRLAQRRHTARVWHREKGVDPDVKEVLDALGKLGSHQRRALLLTQLAAVSMPEMAREIGIPLEQAERELQTGASQLSLALGCPAAMLRTRFERLAASVTGTVRWPRATILRRAGGARRRTHTAVGVAGAVAVVVGSGFAVTDAAGERPTLDRADAAPPSASTTPTPTAEPTSDAPEPLTLDSAAMLPASALTSRYDGRWRVERTGDNHAGTGLVVPCQQDRYADPNGRDALVRVLAPRGEQRERGAAVRDVTQLTELSSTKKAARRTWRTAADWYAGCTNERVQLLATRTPEGVGDQAVQLVLRSWDDPVTTYVVGVARSGEYTTTVFERVPGDGTPERRRAAGVLAEAVQDLCALDEGGTCASDDPPLETADPLPVGAEPSLLSSVDLPPVSGVGRPWAGTEASRPTSNDAATNCDQTSFTGSFRGARFTRPRTRTFVIPKAKLPDEFGLTETAAALPRKRARALVEQVRDDLSSCSDGDLATDVERIRSSSSDRSDQTVWRLEVQVSENRTLTFWMAILREDTAVGQLGFVPGGDRTITREDFLALADRAQARLQRMRDPKT
ncbi:MAG: hypothetical protein CMH83_09130 [Nocardioides sp.]|nr:hypothetical protein [Nocardioides sp.]